MVVELRQIDLIILDVTCLHACAEVASGELELTEAVKPNIRSLKIGESISTMLSGDTDTGEWNVPTRIARERCYRCDRTNILSKDCMDQEPRCNNSVTKGHAANANDLAVVVRAKGVVAAEILPRTRGATERQGRALVSVGQCITSSGEQRNPVTIISVTKIVRSACRGHNKERFTSITNFVRQKIPPRRRYKGSLRSLADKRALRSSRGKCCRRIIPQDSTDWKPTYSSVRRNHCHRWRRHISWTYLCYTRNRVQPEVTAP